MAGLTRRRTPGDGCFVPTTLDFPAAAAAGYGLVLAGHLHGGQCVLATRRRRLYPAAWIYRWHGLRFAEWGAVMLVSRGAGDTLPIRFNCPREVILCALT
jgi:predicted MPP superfamily phosphohydrolase